MNFLMFSWSIVWILSFLSHALSCDAVGSSPLSSRYVVSTNVLFSASCSIGYPRYRRMPISPSIKVMRLLHDAVFWKAGS